MCEFPSNPIQIRVSKLVLAVILLLFSLASTANTIIEDAEDGIASDWTIYDNNPSEASVTNSFDTNINSNVIILSGSGFSNGYRLGDNSPTDGFNLQSSNFVSWRMRSTEPAYFYIATTTTNGFRFLSYRTINDSDPKLISDRYVYTGLGSSIVDNRWHTITRNLQSDLTSAEPGNQIISINGFLVRGSLSIDDITFYDTQPATNTPPLAQAGEDQNIELGQSITLTGTGSDLDGTILDYQWTENNSLLANSASFSYTPTSAGINTITLTVFDDDGEQSSDSININTSLKETKPNLSNYTLAFADEFNEPIGSVLDSNKWDTGFLWGPYLPINNEKQMYIDTLGMHSEFSHSPFAFTGSSLIISATPTSSALQPPARPSELDPIWQPNSYTEYRYNGETSTGPGYQSSDVDYLSGLITSYDSFKMTHGYVEMRAKLPAGSGLWPAFWLLTTHYVEDVPEIDVMEFLGKEKDRLYQTYHYFNISDNWSKISTPSYTVVATDWTEDFHTFGMAWSPSEIIWYVNGEESNRITDSDFKITGQAMYLLANLAVGSESTWAGPVDSSTIFPAKFEIDYIRAYSRKLDSEINLADDYQLIFEDEFTDTFLNPNKWNTRFLWGPYFPINNEEQYYVDELGIDDPTPANSPFVLDNGILSITARKNDDPNSYPIPQFAPEPDDPVWTENPEFQRNLEYEAPNYTSGIITSYDSFKFVHGYAEIKAKIPVGSGLWPAFWLLNGYYVAQQPEIDVMEVRGENPHQIVHSYHRYDSGIQHSDSAVTDNGEPTIGYGDSFHTYGVRWQPGKIDWYIDGNMVHSYENEDVAYQLMYVIANLAIGGNFNFTDVDQTLFQGSDPVSLDIDYIRVYQEKHKGN